MPNDPADDFPGWIDRFTAERFAHNARIDAQCLVCDRPPSDAIGTPVFHASPDLPGLALDFRIVTVAVSTDTQTPFPVCRDCMRALLLRMLDLGF